VTERRPVSDEDKRKLAAARARKDDAEAAWKATVVDVRSRASVREVAAETGLSTQTIERWLRGE
jgi:predicted transcriptional regulator